ncbi:hypothetical protein RUM43_013726 [Polyplax serrata]|uniref:Uncharacterized protein n=1 Tax=Polyplax serrata TaxID=468196 RepID=A0AAN8S660_POLSC
MLDNSIAEGGTRRRSTFYVPLTENSPLGHDKGTDNGSLKKLEKNGIVGFSSPLRKTPKKSPSPHVSENQPLKYSHTSFASTNPVGNLRRTSKIVESAYSKGGLEKTPMRISHSSKPKILDTSKLLNTPSVSVPSLDVAFTTNQSEVKNATCTQSMETLTVLKPESKSLFTRKTNHVKVMRSPSQRLTTDSLMKKVSLRDSNRSMKVPQVVIESDETEESTTSRNSVENVSCHLRVTEEEDAGIHSVCLFLNYEQMVTNCEKIN